MQNHTLIDDECSPLISNTHPRTYSNTDNYCPHEQSNSSSDKKRLWLATALSICFFGLELTAGLYSHSLALLSDSFHLLSDVAGFAISLAALYLAQMPATSRHSFGFHRAEILGTMVCIGTSHPSSFTRHSFIRQSSLRRLPVMQ
jgi:Co/Zn/Cd efflux system component